MCGCVLFICAKDEIVELGVGSDRTVRVDVSKVVEFAKVFVKIQNLLRFVLSVNHINISILLQIYKSLGTEYNIGPLSFFG
jgi:hypothetical protein